MRRNKIETQLYQRLNESLLATGAPCLNDPDRWQGATLPEEDTVDWCAGCPVETFKRCDHYATFYSKEHGEWSVWGVWANKVYGVREDEDERQ